MRVLEFLGRDGSGYALVPITEERRVVAPSWQRVGDAEAAAILEAMRADDPGGVRLGMLWSEESPHGGESVDGPEIHGWVHDELARPTGRVALWRTRSADHAAGGVARTGDAPLLRELAEPPPEVRTWVEFRLLDLAGDPLADVRYEIEMSDGTTEEGTTDAGGKARHDDIVAGACTITFPDLPDRLWEHEHNAE